MKCDICAKVDATVHLTEIIDNKMTKLHLCEECAKNKGAEMEEHFGLSDLLAGLADFEAKVTPKKEARIKCPKCGLTYQDFKKTGRLGCGECYAAFERSLAPLIKRIHGGATHLGKAPGKMSKVPKAQKVLSKKKEAVNTLEEMQARLQRAIKLEEFEDAAKLRDRIRELEKKK